MPWWHKFLAALSLERLRSDGSRDESPRLGVLDGTLSSTRFSLNSSGQSGRSRDESPRTSSLSSFPLGFSVSATPRDESPRTSSPIFSLLVDAGRSVGVTASCDEDVEDARENALEELVDRPGTTIGT